MEIIACVCIYTQWETAPGPVYYLLVSFMTTGSSGFSTVPWRVFNDCCSVDRRNWRMSWERSI